MGIKVKVEESKGFAEIEDGMYEAKLVEIEETTLPEWGERWRWWFEVETEDEETVKVAGLTSRKFSDRSKAYKWFSALTGREPEIGEEVDLDEAVGNECLVEVKNKPGQGGAVFPNVVDVKPVPKKSKKKK